MANAEDLRSDETILKLEKVHMYSEGLQPLQAWTWK